jgi:hypothetical protein
MDFLNHRKGGMVFYQVFLLSPLQCTVTELTKTVICMSCGGKLLRLLSGFRPRILPLGSSQASSGTMESDG